MFSGALSVEGLGAGCREGTSGAIQNGVPTEVFLLILVLDSWADTPAEGHTDPSKSQA